jgi:SNF2 family DNA or RNA helicase
LTIAMHACWTGGTLRLWAEDPGLLSAPRPEGVSDVHPFAATEAALRAAIEPVLTPASSGGTGIAGGAPLTFGRIRVKLPAGVRGPLASTKLAHIVGLTDLPAPTSFGEFLVPAVEITPKDAPFLIDALLDAAESSRNAEGGAMPAFDCSKSIEFFAAIARLARHLLSQQRFVPALHQSVSGDLRGVWQPWVSDEAAAQRVSLLVAGMPPAARAAVDDFGHQPWPIIDDALTRITDAMARRTFTRENLIDAIEGRDAGADLQVAWLAGMLGGASVVAATPAGRQELVRRVRTWISGLEERGASSAWRLMLRLNEPTDPGSKDEDPYWGLSFHLQSVDRPSLVLDASDIWMLPGDSATLSGKRIDGPQELLLGELGRASRIYPRLEKALEDSEPIELLLSTKQAYEFLREIKPVLLEQGFGVSVPDWWDSPMARLGARLRLESDELPPLASANASTSATGSQLGLGTLVRYRWEIALGDTTLSLNEFENLAGKRQPLVKVNGRWVEIRPEDVQAAIKFIRENPGGEMPVGDALRLAYASDVRQTGIQIVGMDASGWLSALINSEAAGKVLQSLEPPATFRGTLRPYQLRGLSWMYFMERLGFGLCLADDMGLGKTIQLLALLAHEREALKAEQEAYAAGSAPPAMEPPSSGDSAETLNPDASPPAAPKAPLPMGPTLLIVPMSVVGNWIHETARFCPHLRVLVHHGSTRLQGDHLLKEILQSDMVVTTYALAHRDKDQLGLVRWRRVVLDEAQYIKNPAAKQAQAVRSLESERRIALTGTPVENRLSELWSIMDFLNPGYLGSAHGFRQRFGIAIERYKDRTRSEQLRGLVRPFVLRRLKTDPTVVADLPDKLESREYCHLTTEQASLYEGCVRRMLMEVDKADGIHRRGLVLSALIKLKQICNHPSQMLKDFEVGSSTPPEPSRSGKCVRIMEMLDEVIAEGDNSLIFTQFRQMGHLLESMLRHRFEKDILFLHGGTPSKQREAMIQRFQKADGSSPILLLSLKAGGVGLNLTAATHVFHFDRWWNPAVENQATDRAYRIGQTRTVQVHKFVVRGTLEERIDQMIEQKIELAQNIIGDGERWLTELSTDQLRDLLTLREDAVGDEV